VYVASFPSFSDKDQLSRGGGGQPVWRSDGKELFYLSLQGQLMAVDTTLGASVEAGTLTSLFQVPMSVNPLIDQYAVTRDGQRFIFCAPANATGQPITVVVNWARDSMLLEQREHGSGNRWSCCVWQAWVEIAEAPSRRANLQRLCRVRNDPRDRRVTVEHYLSYVIAAPWTRIMRRHLRSRWMVRVEFGNRSACRGRASSRI
jgi:hypothetical protein